MKKPTPQEKKEFRVNVLMACFMLWCLVMLLGILTGCKKYQVVSYLHGNLYHLHNPKTKDAEVIMTNDSLIIGNYYKLKDINIIDSPYYKRPRLIKR